ncbi:hypothetical protein Airi02_066990 [Actinoallomurus iriomotensis]|uniref:Transposase n=1 Tax=Actinoallomurus iriomotensis TaxID=478107 RepID=A0A9W6S5M4_9ACTN|nr:hypothetical protein Airi02_066990 [Actinoallomurus iriomotensis]
MNAFAGLPAELARSLTWDQGGEMSRHVEFTHATGNPSTSASRPALAARLEREHERPAPPAFPKGTDLSACSAEDLVTVTAELDNRPPQDPRRANPR